MGIFKNQLSAVLNRRKVADRRTQEQKLPYDRRVQPDRRLNNIQAEWIPVAEVVQHPTLHEAFCNRESKKKTPKTGTEDQ